LKPGASLPVVAVAEQEAEETADATDEDGSILLLDAVRVEGERLRIDHVEDALLVLRWRGMEAEAASVSTLALRFVRFAEPIATKRSSTIISFAWMYVARSGS
jgi:hypothetical protein